MTLRISLTRLIAAATLAALTSGAAVAQGAPERIRFGGFGQGFGQPSGLALLAIAQTKNFIADEFKDQPVQLSFEYLTGVGPAINEALANDRLDFAQYGALPNVVGKAAGLPTRILASYGVTTIFGVARNGLPIKSFADLKGHKVAVPKGTVLHWAFLEALNAHGLTLKDIQLIDLKNADQLAALSAGNIDAAVGSSSLLSLRDQGSAHVFYSSHEVGLKAAGFGAIVVNERFEQQYPDATQRVVRGLVRAADWLGDERNREEALRIWARSGVAYELLREEFAGIELRQAFNPRVDDFLLAQYRNVIDFSKENKLIRSDIDVGTWARPEPVEQAIEALGLKGAWPDRDADGRPVSS